MYIINMLINTAFTNNTFIYREYELVESGGQWREIQRKQAIGGLGTVQQASVRRAVPIEPNDPSQNHHRSSHRHRRHRKHRFSHLISKFVA